MKAVNRCIKSVFTDVLKHNCTNRRSYMYSDISVLAVTVVPECGTCLFLPMHDFNIYDFNCSWIFFDVGV